MSSGAAPSVSLRHVRAAYVHVPFCLQRCGYCDFTVVAGRDDLSSGYLDALRRELSSLGAPHPVSTLFVGGGTPTHLELVHLEQLCRLLQDWLPLEPGGEYTFEANPDGLTLEKVALLAAHGVNRISLGVQAFDQRVLQTLERTHTPDQAAAAVQRVQSRLENVAVDLIFGVPGQSLATWAHSLHTAIALGVPHVSTYGLTIEKGTTFWSRRERGTLTPCCEELERDMYALAMDELPRAGLDQYELSNFARPRRACRHNLTYWNGDEYLAFGPGAARYVHGRRETNHRSTTTWMKRVLSGASPVMDAEQLSDEDRARELLVIGLRRSRGVDLAEFHERTGVAVRDLAGEAVARHLQSGLLEMADGALRVTRAGRFLADTVIVDML